LGRVKGYVQKPPKHPRGVVSERERILGILIGGLMSFKE